MKLKFTPLLILLSIGIFACKSTKNNTVTDSKAACEVCHDTILVSYTGVITSHNVVVEGVKVKFILPGDTVSAVSNGVGIFTATIHTYPKKSIYPKIQILDKHYLPYEYQITAAHLDSIKNAYPIKLIER